MNTLINLKNNLIQNFYIIGFSPEDFFYKNKNDEGEFLNIFKIKSYVNIKPKIISKFPPNNSNFNGVDDETIINHCFPSGFHLIKKEDKDTTPISFFFELDNLLLNYSLDEKTYHSKLYFTCIQILEPLSKYFLYKEEIVKEMGGKIKLKNDGNINDEKYDKIFIPKILCFASILPYYNELKRMLNIIYQDYLEPNNPYKIEKLIEQIVLRIPIPLNDKNKLQISFDSNRFKEKITFPLYEMKDENLKISFTHNLSNIFYCFKEDDILNIIKYIILEVPIIFFCEDMNKLTSTIENFVSLISPFKYVHPYISILPQKFYGFINVEKKFIFGINQKYTKYFFEMNEIELEKNIVVIYFENNQGKIDIYYKQTEENKNDVFIIKDEESTNTDSKLNYNTNFINSDYVMYNGTKTDLINIELPLIAKKKFNEDLHNYISKLKDHTISNFDYCIRKSTYEFFVTLMSGYTDYYIKSKYFFEAYNTKNCGFELLFKKNEENKINDLNFIKEIFNFDEFVNKSDSPLFYFVFCQTKLFFNFLRERIYLNNKNYLMQYRQFDQVCFLKKHKDFRKKKENKGIYDTFKKITLEKTNNKNQNIIEIKLINEDFTKSEQETINKKSSEEMLIKYGQKLTTENGSNSIKYFLFPKLLFDDEFFNTPYENLFLMHNIDMPSSKIIDDYKKLCSLYSVDYYKHRGYMFPPKNIENLFEINNSKANFNITSYYYIFYGWIILLCCSLSYCDTVERIIRLNEIMPVLDKLYYIEEIVLKLIFDTFIKYGNKMQCIKIYEKVTKFYGNSNYLFLNLLTNKLCQEEEINCDDYLNLNNKKEYIIKDRSLILSFESFIKKRMTMSPESNEIKTSDNLNIFRNTLLNVGSGRKISAGNKNKKQESYYKEKIIFSSQQYCKKCKCYNSFDFEEIKKQKLSKINYTYKCIKCKSFSNDVIIKYQILLNNKKRKELYITKMGEFKLLPPNRLYTELMFNLSCQKNLEINIEKITSQNQFNLMNYLFYFSIENLSFDFLFPYKKLDDEQIELIQNNLGSVISDINKRRFSIINNAQTNDINKGLVENKENENFIPIDISKCDNFDKYYNLTPCIIDNEPNELYEENNENNNNEYKSTNYFTINGKK